MSLLERNRISWLTAGFLALITLAPVSVAAQTLNERLTQRQSRENTSRMLVDAREVVYDRDKDRVSAVGDVQVYYQGRILEADRVTYDRKAKRVFAEGNARMTEADGTKTYGTRFDLTDDFRDGFIDTLRVETVPRERANGQTANSRFSAARAERTGGETTVLERGTFTACKACAENPERPPLWQVRAARIIHNNAEQRIYYENATLEFWGVPVAYMPFASAPDPSVTRQSGLLAPRYINKTRLGTGATVPFYWAIAPNYDITFSPTYFSRQGFYGDVLWRHRTENGSYNLRVNGIHQQDRTAFPTQPYLGAGNKTMRGSIESRGKFHLNEKWTFGWDGAWATDKYYFTDYKTRPQSISNLFNTEVVSQVYLRGRGERSWFDLSAYHFTGLHSSDWQRQVEKTAPSFDFDRRFSPDSIGGEVKFTANGTAVSRDAALYQPLADGAFPTFVPARLLYANDARGTYMPCIYDRNGVIVGAYSPGRCLLRGFAGEYVRQSADLSWRRKFIDPIGQEWTPFLGVRIDAAWLNVDTANFNSGGATPYGNRFQSNFFGGNADNFAFRAMPTFGIEYRYPFFAATSIGTHYFEPIAQLIVRPNEGKIGKLPNEDAQSLVFDENSIFALNKFSGYDRVEGGTRLNYGARYSFRTHNDMSVSMLFGQSVHLFGRNSYSQYDLANTGRDSGLETRRSDYVAGLTIQPVQNAAMIARARFDERSFALKRLDLEARGKLSSKIDVSAVYSRIAAQPELGYPLRREGLLMRTNVSLPRNMYVSGGVLFDLDRYLTDRANASVFGGAANGTPWKLAGSTLTVGYRDECTDLSFTYQRSTTDTLVASGTGVQPSRNFASTYLLRLTLTDLGDIQSSRRRE